MLNLSEEAKDGLGKLRADIGTLATKQTITRVRTERNLVDLVRLMFAVGLSVIVLYAGLIMVWNYTLLFDRLPQILLLMILCLVGLGLLGNYKKKEEVK